LPAEIQAMARKKPSESFKLGDRVRIRYTEWRGRIVEERGPLAPGRVLVFRVRIPGKPKPTYIEVREDQLIAIPTPPKLDPSSLLISPRGEIHPPKIKAGETRKRK
jgi:hypothetical protein